MNIIDGLARETQDPQISVHISNVSSAVESVVRVSITFIGYDIPKYVSTQLANNLKLNQTDVFILLYHLVTTWGGLGRYVPLLMTLTYVNWFLSFLP